MPSEPEPHPDQDVKSGQHGLGPHVVGLRVVVRRLLRGRTGPTGGPAMTDLLGVCLSWADGTCVVQPETGDPVKRLIQPVGIAFKGSGFYVNDSRSTNSAAKPGSAKTDKGEGSSTEVKSSDSKSDSKSDKTDSKADNKSEKKPEKAASAG